MTSTRMLRPLDIFVSTNVFVQTKNLLIAERKKKHSSKMLHDTKNMTFSIMVGSGIIEILSLLPLVCVCRECLERIYFMVSLALL